MAVKSSSKSSTRRTRKKSNLLKLNAEMNKVAHDAVDREIIKRFKIVIDTSEEDITKSDLSIILKNTKPIDLSLFDESLQPYVKHYLFMKKRDEKKR